MIRRTLRVLALLLVVSVAPVLSACSNSRVPVKEIDKSIYGVHLGERIDSFVKRVEKLNIQYEHQRGEDEQYVFSQGVDGSDKDIMYLGVVPDSGFIQMLSISFADTSEGKLQSLISSINGLWGDELLKYKFDRDQYKFLLHDPPLYIELNRRNEIGSQDMSIQLYYTYSFDDPTMIDFLQQLLESEPPKKPLRF